MVAPTAAGKSAMAKTILSAHKSVAYLTPTNLLVEQFLTEFPDTRTLSRLDAYWCEEWQRPCSVTRGKLKGFCRGCACGKDVSNAKYRRGPLVLNYHTYLSQKLYRDVLVVDEAHNLLPQIRERQSLTIWAHEYRIPTSAKFQNQLRAWFQSAKSLSKNQRMHKKIIALEDALFAARPQYTVVWGKEMFNGKGTKRGEPEERDCLKLLPVNIREAPPMFWPKEVQKIILLSATISRKDIEALGLDKKKVLYIDCDSPIPANQRPVSLHNVVSVNRDNLLSATVQIGEYIRDVLAPAHIGEKGVIHATYQQADILSSILNTPGRGTTDANSNRFIFHSRHNKKSRYQEFLDSPPELGKVLVACGMHEGMDLPEDLGRWQALAKIPWPSLGDPAVKYQADEDPEWYLWECLKVVVQACGRVCRTPSDYGCSYILDASVQRLLHKGKNLIPSWFQDAIEAGK